MTWSHHMARQLQPGTSSDHKGTSRSHPSRSLVSSFRADRKGDVSIRAWPQPMDKKEQKGKRMDGRKPLTTPAPPEALLGGKPVRCHSIGHSDPVVPAAIRPTVRACPAGNATTRQSSCIVAECYHSHMGAGNVKNNALCFLHLCRWGRCCSCVFLPCLARAASRVRVYAASQPRILLRCVPKCVGEGWLHGNAELRFTPKRKRGEGRCALPP